MTNIRIRPTFTQPIPQRRTIIHCSLSPYKQQWPRHSECISFLSCSQTLVEVEPSVLHEIALSQDICYKSFFPYSLHDFCTGTDKKQQRGSIRTSTVQYPISSVVQDRCVQMQRSGSETLDRRSCWCLDNFRRHDRYSFARLCSGMFPDLVLI